MSVHTIEKILWQFGDEPERVNAFLKDPDAYLAQYQLTDDEFEMLRKMDMKAIDEYGVSNLLAMMAWPLLNGNNQLMMFDYLRRLNHGTLPNNFKLPNWQFNAIRTALWVRNTWVKTLSAVGLKKSLV